MSVGLNLALLFLQFAGWGTALAGLAILTNNCATKNDFNELGVSDNPTLFLFGLDLVSQWRKIQAIYAPNQSINLKYECGMQYSWYWTVVFLQFVALLIGLAAQITNKKSRTAAMAMYSTVTALWCVWVYPMITNAYMYYTVLNITSNMWGKAYCVASAGAVAVLVGDFIYMFAQDSDYFGAAYELPPAGPPGTVPAYPPHGGFQAA